MVVPLIAQVPYIYYAGDLVNFATFLDEIQLNTITMVIIAIVIVAMVIHLFCGFTEYFGGEFQMEYLEPDNVLVSTRSIESFAQGGKEGGKGGGKGGREGGGNEERMRECKNVNQQTNL